jgi:hypothetical protein
MDNHFWQIFIEVLLRINFTNFVFMRGNTPS